MPYRHKVVEGLAQLIDKYGGKGGDPFMRAIWAGIKSQVPSLLKSLDESKEAVELIEKKMREALGIKEGPIIQVIDVEEASEPVAQPAETITLIIEAEQAPQAPQEEVKLKRRRRTEEEKMENVGHVEPTEE